MNTWEGDREIKKRIQGSISSLLQTRAGDRMKALIQAGAITEEQCKAWQKLRNINAHAYQIHNEKHEKFVELLFQVNVLLYHLIFHAIGYKGPYTDFGTNGWLTKQYPNNTQ